MSSRFFKSYLPPGKEKKKREKKVSHHNVKTWEEKEVQHYMREQKMIR